MLFLGFALSKKEVRSSGLSLVRALLAWKIVACVLTTAIYVTFIVLLARSLGLWTSSQLKPTLYWVFTAALVMLFDIGSVTKDERYFRKALLDGFKVSVILEFIVNLYPFSLAIELLLVPIATILAGMLVVAESREESKPVRSSLNAITALLGLALLVHTGYWIYTNLRAFAQPSTLVEFFLPLALTVVLLPFLYVMATLVTYEDLFVRLPFLIQDKGLQRFAKRQLLRRCGLNFHALNRCARRILEERPTTQEEMRSSIHFAAIER